MRARHRLDDEGASFSLLYLMAVFLGNVYVAVLDVEVDGWRGGTYPWVRLPLHLLFVGLALQGTREASARKT